MSLDIQVVNREKTWYDKTNLLAHYFRLIRVVDTLEHVWAVYYPAGHFPTSMMTTSVDWESDGSDVGSNTDELDWKDWKRPVISLLRAKLSWNRTSTQRKLSGNDHTMTGFSHKIRNRSIKEDKKRILLSWTLGTVYSWLFVHPQIVPGNFRWLNSPSKSRATISSSSVGETDIHTPSNI